MVDIKILWPDAGTPMHSPLRVAIIIDQGACASSGASEDLQRALREFDDFIGRAPLMTARMDCTLLAPQNFLSGLEMRNVVTEATPGSETSARATVAVHFERLIHQYHDQSEASGAIARHSSPSWLVILSGGTNDNHGQWPEDMMRLLKQRAMTVIPVLVGSNQDEIFLSSFGQSRPALRLQPGGASRLFSWLGREFLRVAGAPRGRPTSLDIAGMEAWAQV